MTSQHFGCIHYGSPETSQRLKRTLDYLLDRGEAGATTMDIITGAQIAAVSAAIAELRQWVSDTQAPVDIPFARYDGMTAGGSKVYRYWARRIEPGGQVVLI